MSSTLSNAKFQEPTARPAARPTAQPNLLIAEGPHFLGAVAVVHSLQFFVWLIDISLDRQRAEVGMPKALRCGRAKKRRAWGPRRPNVYEMRASAKNPVQAS